jgi:uncharacterized protein YxjI
MDFEKLQAQQRLLIRQRVTFMVNRYEVHTAGPNDYEGEMVAFAQQFVLAAFKARKMLDLASTYDVIDHTGQPIGNFRKDFGRSLLRSTWHLEQPNLGVTTGTERNEFVAILRRMWNFIPYVENLPFAWPYHFDFSAGGQVVFSVEKKFGIRDRYVVDIWDPRLDRRLVIAQAVGLDALQSR